MVRHYISRKVGGYFNHEMGPLHHGLVLLALGLALVPVVLGVFALQLGVVVLAHEFVLYFWSSWTVFLVAAVVAFVVAGLALARGVYELFSFVFHTWHARYHVGHKLSMSLGFVIDFLMSDVLMALSMLVLSYTYLVVGINQRYGSLWLILVSVGILWVGVFFQVGFVSAYANAKRFGRVVDAAKRFVVASPEVELLSRR